MTAEQLAEKFHTLYETLAPDHGYETRKESAVAWADVPAKNKGLMIEVCRHLLSSCNELSVEDLTERFYAVKEQRDALRRAALVLIEGAESEGWDRYRGTDDPRTGFPMLREALARMS